MHTLSRAQWTPFRFLSESKCCSGFLLLKSRHSTTNGKEEEILYKKERVGTCITALPLSPVVALTVWVLRTRYSFSEQDNKPDQTPTLIVQSIADFCGVHEENTLVNLSYVNPVTLITQLKRIDLCAQAHLVIGANHTIFA